MEARVQPSTTMKCYPRQQHTFRPPVRKVQQLRPWWCHFFIRGSFFLLVIRLVSVAGPPLSCTCRPCTRSRYSRWWFCYANEDIVQTEMYFMDAFTSGMQYNNIALLELKWCSRAAKHFCTQWLPCLFGGLILKRRKLQSPFKFLFLC